MEYIVAVQVVQIEEYVVEARSPKHAQFKVERGDDDVRFLQAETTSVKALRITQGADKS